MAKYETFEKCPDKNIRSLFSGQKGGFEHSKQFGAGRDTILKFLGKNWKQPGSPLKLAMVSQNHRPRGEYRREFYGKSKIYFRS